MNRKTAFIIIRVLPEFKVKVEKKAKSLRVDVSKLLRPFLEKFFE